MEVVSVTLTDSWRHNQQQRTVAFRLSAHTVAATRKYQRECAKVTAETHFSTHALVMRISHLRDLRGNFCAPTHPDWGKAGLLEHHEKTQKVDLPDKNHTITPIRASTFTASYPATLPSLPFSLSPRPRRKPGRAGYCKFLRILRNPGNLHAMQCVPGVFPLHSRALIS